MGEGLRKKMRPFCFVFPWRNEILVFVCVRERSPFLFVPEQKHVDKHTRTSSTNTTNQQIHFQRYVAQCEMQISIRFLQCHRSHNKWAKWGGLGLGFF